MLRKRFHVIISLTLLLFAFVFLRPRTGIAGWDYCHVFTINVGFIGVDGGLVVGTNEEHQLKKRDFDDFFSALFLTPRQRIYSNALHSNDGNKKDSEENKD